MRSSLLMMPGVARALEQAQHVHPALPVGPRKLTFLSAVDAAEIAALAAEIIPADDDPGAEEAGVIFFIDKALATFDKDKRELYREGMADAQKRRLELFSGSTSIAQLSSKQRIQLLTAIEKTPFFQALRMHTVVGFLADPSWGGNRDKAGWKTIGFEDKWIWKPPFGYYDAPENLK